MSIETTPPPESRINISATQVVDHYLESYSAFLDKKYGDLFGAFLKLSGKGVEEYATTLDVLKSETAGEKFCNDLIGSLGVSLGIDNETFKKARDRESTALTYEVADLLGKKLEEMTQLSPTEQWQVLEKNTQQYATKKLAQLNAKVEGGEALSPSEERELSNISDILQ